MSRIKGTLVIAAACLACGAAVALAGDQKPKTAAERRQAAQERRAEGWEHFLAGFDGDKDGRVSKEELLAKRPGFDMLDKDADGFVTREEVKALPAARQRPGITGFIDRFDGDKDGKVSVEEWNGKRVKVFERADRNQDGSVDRDEFVTGGRELGGA